MSQKSDAMVKGLVVGYLLAAVLTVHGQTAPADFRHEPDKTMAKAHESFVKGNKKKASAEIHQAAAHVRQQSDKAAGDSKAGLKKAGDDLDKVGEGVKKGTVKSGDELKKAFAKTDRDIARCWHQTAEQSKKAGKDASDALKKAGTALDGAARWSGTKLKEGTQSSVDAAKKFGKSAGKDIKKGGAELERWFKDIGEGIKDFGNRF